MKREILISASASETWVAILEDGELVQAMLDRPDRDRIVGHVFKGRVDAVLPGIQAAFVDIGMAKAGFLHVSDLDAGGRERYKRRGGDRGAKGKDMRTGSPIQERLSRGDSIIVQVTKEPISDKGPKLTAEISLPGRFLIYLPHSDHVGVSRKIADRAQRHRLREMATSVIGKGGGGVIVRTVSEEVTPELMRREYSGLTRAWKRINKRADSLGAPGIVHREPRLISGVIRDVFSDRFESIRIEPKKIHHQVLEYVREIAPDLADRVHPYSGPAGTLLEKSGVSDGLARSFEPQVPLKSGGHLVIESTEALVAIDVNTGRFTGSGDRDPADTVLRTNLEAAREISRQLRLRDIGGLVVIDFIDMEDKDHQAKVVHELRSHLGRDRARTQTHDISPFGLLEMTRQRVRPPLVNAVTVECRSCEGVGRVYSPATVARRMERSVRKVAEDGAETRLTVCLHPEAALHVLEEESWLLPTLRKATRLSLDLRDDPVLREDEMRLLAGKAEVDVTAKYC